MTTPTISSSIMFGATIAIGTISMKEMMVI
jgi:hypothetical protein